MKYRYRIFDYVDEIPNTVWDNFSAVENKYFTKPYLKAFEEHNSNKVQFYYIVIFKDNLAVSLATIQVLEFDVQANDFTSNSNRFVQKLSYHLTCLMKDNYVKIIICGSAFLSGEHGIYIKPDENKKEVLEAIVKGTQKIINSNRYLKKWVDIILLKDFIEESLPITNNLKRYNYSAVQVDPNMVLTIDDNWSSYEDYLASFKSKFRVKAKKADKTSCNLVSKDLDEKAIKVQKDDLTALYHNVRDKASFNPETLNLSTYASLKLVFGEDFICKGYYLDDKLVGFMSGLINQGTLDAHYVGLNYELNKEHAIYSRMLYDYVKIAIERNVKYVNFGRTAGEIKSTLGAVPNELTCYVRHKKSVTNFLFKPILRKIKPKPFEQRFPFKKEKAPK